MDTAGVSEGTLLTADDVAELADNGVGCELIEGVLHQMPPGGFDHGHSPWSSGADSPSSCTSMGWAG